MWPLMEIEGIINFCNRFRFFMLFESLNSVRYWQFNEDILSSVERNVVRRDATV